jgi:hypothetical protein
MPGLAIGNHDSVGARNSPAYGGGHDLRHVEPQPATDPVAGQSSATRRLSDRWNSHVQHARRLLSANEAVKVRRPRPGLLAYHLGHGAPKDILDRWRAQCLGQFLGRVNHLLLTSQLDPAVSGTHADPT